ncbi:MAG: glycosyltransferase [Candidatus Alcyoniella australis]|nr:glycosyltransferase [Candidatus Alcyoniella australis]
MSAEPRFSIVIPHLDAPLIDRVLLAALEQAQRLDGELIVIGMERGTRRLDPWRTAVTPRLTLIDTDRPLNAGSARNMGVDAAVAERLLFIDADAVPQPGWAATLCAALEHSPLCGGSVEFGAATRWMLADNLAAFFDLTPLTKRGPTRSICSVNMGITRSLFRRLSGFDQRLNTGEDFDLLLRALEAGIHPLFEPAARVLHLPQRNSREALQQHARDWAAGSVLVRKRRNRPLLPGPLFRPLWLRLLGAPLALMAATVSLWRARRVLDAPWELLGPVYCSRRAWFRQAAQTLGGEGR